jgi:spoIIIJ-associated protein
VKELEISAKTVEEAVQLALEQLGVDESQIEVSVMRKGRSGVLGVGSEEAVVKVTLLDGVRENGETAQIAKDALEQILRTIDIDGDVWVAEGTEQAVSLNIEGDDLGILIGRRGQTLASLQYIIRLIVAEKVKCWVPINIDVAGYKKRRYDSLRNLAERLAEQVKENGRSISLEPMPADERRIIHMTLAENPDIFTQSTGEGDIRKVVIQLKKR